MTDLKDFRATMQREIDTKLSLRAARAHRFLALTQSGVKVTEAWQVLATDKNLLDAERKYLEARADRVIAQIEMTGSAGSMLHEGDDDGES